ncbi:hypothetical protein GDO78_009051 [Eleutherodactylus coqui]|uniref:Xylose isomerase-like TIM barrel domain-containing protein n=1 Tax=Eleutherodactylus coqui TaxID=57060 RepID=A0A8J6K8C5_ELECQ|nr:hypothetical protein GDO78_009051 [Eleutherodactylus coqui]
MPPPPLRFAANVSWLFPDVPDLPGRIVAAGRAGFRAVEVAWPYAADRGALKAALRAGAMELVLMNTPAGDREPGRPVLLGYRIHIMAGRVPAHVERSSIEKEMEETFIENLRYAADILNQADIVGLIEPINCRITEPRYFLNTPQQGAAILQKVGRPNMKMQMDLYHWQIMDGNLTENIKTYFPLIGEKRLITIITQTLLMEGGALTENG